MDTRLTMCHRDQWTGGEFIVWVEYIGNGGVFVSMVVAAVLNEEQRGRRAARQGGCDAAQDKRTICGSQSSASGSAAAS